MLAMNSNDANPFNDTTPLSTEVFQAACRKEFAYLTESFGFKEVPPVPNESRDQVAYEKQGWKIVVVGTAHGTRASIVIYSPDARPGFFSYLINRNSEMLKTREFGTGQLGDISFHAFCLQIFGSAFLGEGL